MQKDSGAGGGEEGFDLSQFLGPDGVRIQFGSVAEVGVGAVIGAIFSGVASLVFGLFDIPIALASGFADFLGQLVGVLVGLPSVLIDVGFAAAIPFVLDAGPAGYVVAIGITLVTLYVLSWVVNRVRE
jgi:hypothetical protein